MSTKTLSYPGYRLSIIIIIIIIIIILINKIDDNGAGAAQWYSAGLWAG
jgi:hypothetical protein